MSAKIYPWDKWFEKKELRLWRGKHYQCQTYVMAQQIRNAAAARNKRISIEIINDNLIVTVIPNRRGRKKRRTA